MNEVILRIGTVEEVEDEMSFDGADGARVRARLLQDKVQDIRDIPWAFPLMPKMFHSIPKVGEAVLVITDRIGNNNSQRYYIGPIISQPQYNTFERKDDATSLLMSKEHNAIGKISNFDDTRGSFPKKEDIAVIGRGREDVTLKFDEKSKRSEVDIRAGIRKEPALADNKELFGNIIFNDIDPTYIQVKYKENLANDNNGRVNSTINLVSDRVNIISTKDNDVSHNVVDKDQLIADDKTSEVMDNLHQVPLGDKLVELLNIMKGCILHHVHPWSGMEECGDRYGDINRLSEFDIGSILSKFVRVS